MLKSATVAAFVICLAAAAAMTACRSGQPAPEFKTPYFSGGIKILSWSGKISGRLIIAYSPYGLNFGEESGVKVLDSNSQRHADMPQVPGLCYIDDKGSSARIAILTQPTAENTYTCEVQIFNPSEDLQPCSFDLYFLPHEEGP